MKTLEIGNRRELFIDDYLIHRLVGGAAKRLHSPVRREAALVTDKPWEGCCCSFPTVTRGGRGYRLYYKGWQINLEDFDGTTTTRPPTICLAESTDGIHWERLNVNSFAYDGNCENNIIWMGVGEDHLGMHGFSPFLDSNPDCQPDQKWKAVGGGWRYIHHGLYLMASPDGIHWSLISDQPFLAGYSLDSNNTVHWIPEEGCYRIFLRHYTEGVYKGIRNIMTATSTDLKNWTDPVELDFGDTPAEHLYDNNLVRYHRAPHIWLGFPTRYIDRPWSPTLEALPEPDHRLQRKRTMGRFGTVLTEPLLMCSRDARVFHRWQEAFMRPGLRSQDSWTYGDNFLGWGMIETDSDLPGGGKELSMFVTEHYGRGESTTLRRCTLRLDGFVSVQAPMRGGELVTHPLTFSGNRLSLNISTSAGGGARVEIQEPDGKPVPGYTEEDCAEIVGDALDYTVRWKHGTGVDSLAGRPVRLRFILRDADLYAMRFESL